MGSLIFNEKAETNLCICIIHIKHIRKDVIKYITSTRVAEELQSVWVQTPVPVRNCRQAATTDRHAQTAHARNPTHTSTPPYIRSDIFD